MKDKILEQFEKLTATEHISDDVCYGEDSEDCNCDYHQIKNFISQALDEYADWKIKECLPDYENDKNQYTAEYRAGFNACRSRMENLHNQFLDNMALKINTPMSLNKDKIK